MTTSTLSALTSTSAPKEAVKKPVLASEERMEADPLTETYGWFTKEEQNPTVYFNQSSGTADLNRAPQAVGQAEQVIRESAAEFGSWASRLLQGAVGETPSVLDAIGALGQDVTGLGQEAEQKPDSPVKSQKQLEFQRTQDINAYLAAEGQRTQATQQERLLQEMLRVNGDPGVIFTAPAGLEALRKKLGQNQNFAAKVTIYAIHQLKTALTTVKDSSQKILAGAGRGKAKAGLNMDANKAAEGSSVQSGTRGAG